MALSHCAVVTSTSCGLISRSRDRHSKGDAAHTRCFVSATVDMETSPSVLYFKGKFTLAQVMRIDERSACESVRCAVVVPPGTYFCGPTQYRRNSTRHISMFRRMTCQVIVNLILIIGIGSQRFRGENRTESLKTDWTAVNQTGELQWAKNSEIHLTEGCCSRSIFRNS